MFENFEFPHVHTYEGDLGWLIHAYKKLIKDYSELLAKVTQMEEDYNNINPTINAAIARMEAMINAAITNMNAQLAAMQAQVDNEIARLRKEVQEQLSQYFALIVQLEQIVSTFQTYMKSYVDGKCIAMQKWLEQRLNELAFDRAGWNPVWGKADSIRQSMEDVYVFDSFGTHVQYFDGLNITAQELDDIGIRADEFDTKARWYLFWYWLKREHILQMANPWTGQMDDPRHVLLMLIGSHQEGVEVQTFDNAELTVEKLEDADVTAYDWDWTHGWFDALIATA